VVAGKTQFKNRISERHLMAGNLSMISP
jgi:hypothetical protein